MRFVSLAICLVPLLLAGCDGATGPGPDFSSSAADSRPSSDRQYCGDWAREQASQRFKTETNEMTDRSGGGGGGAVMGSAMNPIDHDILADQRDRWVNARMDECLHDKGNSTQPR